MVNETHWCQNVNDAIDKYLSFLCGIIIVAFVYFAHLMMEVITSAEAIFTQLVVASSGIFCCGVWAGVCTLIIAQDIKKRIKEKKV